MLNKETGELELDPFQDGTLYHDRETGENSSYPTYELRRERSKFSIPKQYLRSGEVLPSSSGHQYRRKPACCVAKVNASYPLASREKMMHLKEEIILGYNKTSYLLLLIPPLFVMPKLAIILILLSEVLLHRWAHAKNDRNRSPDIYYRSPLHIVSIQFCGMCRHERQMDRIVQLQDKRMRQMQNYFRKVTRNIA
ncbi:hypothetical protein quinque_000224 [Culex quinquefasciatus]|uniref:uncharacterized protein LOC6034572 n=1 Tax=Culex quinquefasciatus TaxID=7176 RepID=UPI0018E381B1|nr:uncharacterized protein LOC6034572 [Culex quinquefasciatus]XP_039443282.1 uncharacterized protein LOC120423507 [Culex pipiens pallens]